MAGGAVLAVIGLAMIGFLEKSTPRYVGAFLGEAGTNGVIVTGMAWCQNNIRGDAKRAVGTGIQIIVAGIDGVYSALVFRQQVRKNLIMIMPSPTDSYANKTRMHPTTFLVWLQLEHS